MNSAPKSTTPVDARIGARIRMRRLVIGMSQTELGRSSGVTFQQIQKYENGTNRVSVGRLHNIAQTLGVPVEFFYEGLSDAAPAAAADVPDVAGLLGKADALAMLKAFTELENPAVRRGLVSLTKQLVEAQGRGGAARGATAQAGDALQEPRRGRRKG